MRNMVATNRNVLIRKGVVTASRLEWPAATTSNRVVRRLMLVVIDPAYRQA